MVVEEEEEEERHRAFVLQSATARSSLADGCTRREVAQGLNAMPPAATVASAPLLQMTRTGFPIPAK